MKTLLLLKTLLLSVFACLLSINLACAQSAAPKTDSVMITILLKHQQDKNLDTIQAIEKKNKFDKLFPPPGARIVSWYVMMGIGQVVTVKIPASELRNLNLSIEKGAWGAFNTEFYPTYDYMPVWKASQNNDPQLLWPFCLRQDQRVYLIHQTNK